MTFIRNVAVLALALSLSTSALAEEPWPQEITTALK
jgi:hypothetical protein